MIENNPLQKKHYMHKLNSNIGFQKLENVCISSYYLAHLWKDLFVMNHQCGPPFFLWHSQVFKTNGKIYCVHYVNLLEEIMSYVLTLWLSNAMFSQTFKI
jgi:hypothetical protein